jgi:hypothetical protein
MPNNPKASAAQKSALKDRIKSMLTVPPMSGGNPANPNANVEPPMAPPAPAPKPYYGPETMMGPQLPSYYVPAEDNVTANDSYDTRRVARYEGGRYRGINNEEVDPTDIGYRYASYGDPNAYEKPTKIVRKGKYATKK